MTALKLITPPATEPVTLAEAKAQARIETTADDSLITSLITAARQWAEHYTNRAFITQGWQLWMDADDAESPYIVLPRAPLSAVNSFKTYDATDTATVWSADYYFVDTMREPGRLALRSGASWPYAGRGTNGICIDYIAGYGASAANVPEAIRTAIRQLVTHWYENRGEVWSDSLRAPRDMPMVITALLEPHRVRSSGV